MRTLVLRGGSYREQVLNPTVARGTANQPITVAAAAGERPVITGLFWLTNTDHWTLNGINVTWDATNNASNQHMVNHYTHGTGWTWKNAELWGAKSFAAMLIAGDARNYTIAGNYIHDTAATNGINQDHLLYVNTTGTGGGRIHHNLLVGSPNGRAVKVGAGSSTYDWDVRNIEIDHNTMFDNQGPSNIQLAFDAFNIHIHHNIMVRSGLTRNDTAPAQRRHRPPTHRHRQPRRTQPPLRNRRHRRRRPRHHRDHHQHHTRPPMDRHRPNPTSWQPQHNRLRTRQFSRRADDHEPAEPDLHRNR